MDGRGGKGGGKAGNTSMDWINSTLWVLMQFWRWGWERKVNSIDCFDVATQFQIFYDYIWDDFIILLQIVWGEKKLENYIIIAKETDFWLPKQACMIVLLISCPSFPLSDLTYFFIHTYLISFFLFCFVCMEVLGFGGFFWWSSLYWPIPERIHDCQLCALGGFEMLQCWSLCHEQFLILQGVCSSNPGQSSVSRGITGDWKFAVS